MKIGAAAERSGLSSKTVRYYADIGLVRPAARTESGYRDYGGAEIRKLRFVRKARAFGFSVSDCRELLSLYEDRTRKAADVKRLALARLGEIDARMAELKHLRAELDHLARKCHGDERPDCPILDGFSEDGGEKG